MNSPQPLIAAVIVTFRRDLELVRLLASLEASSLRPTIIIVMDHAASVATEKLIARFDLNTIYVASADNPGPGVGWKRGMETALARQPATTHFLVLDDDVVLPPEVVLKLQLATAAAAIACPLLLDAKDKIWAFPEPVNVVLRKKIREVQTQADAIHKLGTDPQAFQWCTGACLMVRRDAVDAVGFYRTDFWMLGEDLEYSMRVAAWGGGVFLPDVFVPHLPPQAVQSDLADAAHRRKFNSLLQNLAYLSFHHANSGHLRNYLPGNAHRYLKTFGWNPRSLGIVVACLWNGAVRGRPAGAR